MYYSTQTLVHKEKNTLARLANENENSTFHWGDNCNGTLFIDEFGNNFVDDINNYTNIEDEFGNPYANNPKKGEFVDISAKKYLVSEDKLKEMRGEGLRKIKIMAVELRDSIFSEMIKANSENYVSKRDASHNIGYPKAYYCSSLKLVSFYFHKYESKYFNFINWLVDYLPEDSLILTQGKRIISISFYYGGSWWQYINHGFSKVEKYKK